MSRCTRCKAIIVFGGFRDSTGRYCSEGCIAKAKSELAATAAKSEKEQQAEELGVNWVKKNSRKFWY